MSNAATRDRVGYEDDFGARAHEQACRVCANDFAALDLGNVAEEIKSLTRHERRERRSGLAMSLPHLLNWQHRQDRHSKGWSSSIRGQRVDIEEFLRESATLRPSLPEMFPRACKKDREEALDRIGVYTTSNPRPWTLYKVAFPDFHPD